MKKSSTGNLSKRALKLVSTSFNLALFASCGQALAHGGPQPGPQPGLLPGQHVQSWAAHGPVGFATSFASTVPLTPNATVTPFVHQMHSQFQSATHAPALQTTLFRNHLIQLQPSSISSTGSPVELDLTSASATVRLQPGIISQGSEVSVSLDGIKTTFHTGDMVTPGELVAIYQSQGYGGQKIILDSQGRADGGSFSLNSVLAPTRQVQVSGIVVPQNVSAFDYVSGKSNLSLSGDLLNYGSIIDITRGGQQATANISALNIVNESGGLISTVGRHGDAGVVDLNLSAMRDFTNMGTISSSGALNISAGHNLVNGVAVSGGTGGAAVASITAVGSVNLQAPNIVNSGSISSTSGDITLGTAAGSQNLQVDNTQGVISALTGNINIRDAGFNGSGNAHVFGGDLLSQNLNLNSGEGTINVDVHDLTGAVVSSGNAVHVNVSTSNLVLGAQKLTGDPTYYNDAGDITITAPIDVSEDLAIVASGNILATSGLTHINAIDGTGQGKNISLIAGATITTTDTNSTSTIPGNKAAADVQVSFTGNPGGAAIDLSGADPNLSISSASNTGNKNGGNVLIAAFGSAGGINLPSSSNIDASGNGTGTGGDVTICSGRVGTVNGLLLGSISHGLSAGAGNVIIADRNPGIIGTPTFAPDGSLKNGSFFVDYSGPSTAAGIKISGPVFASGAVTISGGATLNAGSTVVLGGDVVANNISVVTGTDLTINGSLLAPGGILLASGHDIATGVAGTTISSQAKSGTAGNIMILAGMNVTQDATQVSFDINIGGKIDFSKGLGSLSSSNTGSGAGGNITLVAASDLSNKTGTIDLGNTPLVTTGGAAGGANGSVTLVSAYNDSPSPAGGINIPNGIDVTGGQSGTGNISQSYSQPLSSAPVVVSRAGVSIVSGTFFDGNGRGGQGTTFGTLGPLKMDGGDYYLAQASTINVTGPLVTGTIGNLTLFSNGFQQVIISADISANSIALISYGNIVFNNKVAVAAPGGLTMISAGNISTSNAAGTTFSTDSATTAAGDITAIAGANFVYSGNAATIFGSINGSIDFATTPIAGLSATSTASRGGNITLVALSNLSSSPVQGNVFLPTALTVTTSGSGTVNGDFTAVGSQNSGSGFAATAIKIGNVDVTNGGLNFIGGKISLVAGVPDFTTAIKVNTLSGVVTGNFASTVPNSTISDIVAGNLIAPTIFVNSSQNVQLGNLNASPPFAGSIGGGSVTVLTHGTQQLVIGAPTGKNFTGTISASGGFTSGARGSVTLANFDDAGTGNGGIQISTTAIAQTGHGGGKLDLTAGSASGDIIDLTDYSTINFNADVTNPSTAGNVSLKGYDVVWTGKGTTKLSISADGTFLSTGPGGIVYEVANNAKLSLDSTSQIMLSAKGFGTTSSGNITVESGGSIVYDPTSSAINITPGASSGVGTLKIMAGFFQDQAIGAGNSTLLVSGPIDLSATAAASQSGSVVFGSNSATVFNVGALKSNTNGVLGTITVGGGTHNGDITIVNAAGGVTNVVPFTIVNNVTMISGGAGSVIVAAPTGSLQTQTITLHADGTGNILQSSSKSTIAAGTVDLFSAGGSIGSTTALVVSTSNLTANAGINSNITLDPTIAGLTLGASSAQGGKFTLNAPNADVKANSISAITAITVTAKSLDASGAFVATDPTGVISIVAKSGDITGSGANDFSAGKSVTLTASKGLINIGSVGNTLKAGTTTATLSALSGITLNGTVGVTKAFTAKTTSTTSGTGSIVFKGAVTAIDAAGTVAITSGGGDITVDKTSDISAGKSVVLTATKGAVSIGSAGFGKSTGTITISALKGITSNGDIQAVLTTTLKTTSKAVGDGNIILGGSLVATDTSKGVVAVTASGATGITSALGSDISGGKSVTLTATNGSVSFDSIGSSLTGAVVLTALNNITSTGGVTANTSLTAKATSTTVGAITFGGDLVVGSMTGPTGTIALTAAGGDVKMAGGATSKILAGKSVAITATKGAISVGTIGSKLNPQTIALTAATKIETFNNLVASKTVTLKTTNATGTNGDIFVHGDILAYSATSGAVTLTSSSIVPTVGVHGIVVDATADISACKTVTLTAAKGSIVTGKIGQITATQKVGMSALGTVKNSGIVQGTVSVSETVTGAGGLILANADILAAPTGPATTGALVLTAKNGSIDTTGFDISAGKSIVVTSTTGGIILGSVGKTNAPTTVSAKAVTTIKTNDVINAVTSVTLASSSKAGTDGITINGNINTTAGFISVISAGGKLTVGNGANILASSSGKTKATILLQDSNLTSGVIALGNGTIKTSGTAGSDVKISVGTPPAKGVNPISVSGAPIAGLTVVVATTGTVFLGPTNVLAPTSAKVTLKGANVIFSAPATRIGSIILNGTQVEADPPAILAAPAVSAHTSIVQAASRNVVVSDIATPAQNQNALMTPSASANAPDLAAITMLSSLTGLSNAQGLAVASGAGFGFAAGSGSGSARTLYGGISDTRRWISATEIAGGEIPVTVLTNKWQLNLDKGSVLAMPTTDSVLHTPAGDVFVAKGSLALVMALDGGVAVYNLHDTRKDAVTITSGARKVALQPGTSAVIVPSHVTAFEHVNPAQLVSYRRIVEHEFGSGLKAYRSEFAIQTAIHAVRPLKALVVSGDKSTSRIATQFLKTLTILMQLQAGGEKFNQFMRPQMTAWK